MLKKIYDNDCPSETKNQTNKNLTGNVLFLQLHLVLQVCQQCFTPLVYSEADRVEIIAGGL